MDSPFNAREIIQGLATRFREGDTLPDGQTLYAAQVTQAAARTVVTYTNWYVAERFPDTSLLKNPGLKNPPAPRL
ncbi:MAG TPA: hypothetical protein VEF76_07300 [Patescibacteria group bacterium]|nr:hypothetical protein [Patescibacteria group bacterium]